MMKQGKYILLMLLASSFLVLSGLAQSVKTMSVQVKEGQLRKAPSFLAAIVARPSYGESVQVLEDKGDWKRVSLRGSQGWIHASALTTKLIVLQAGRAAVPASATGSEIALAGKGFSEEVEKQYRSQNRSVDYTWVDRMEKFKVSPEQMQAFLMDGLVAPREGGAQ
jgi:hypothetical protein